MLQQACRSLIQLLSQRQFYLLIVLLGPLMFSLRWIAIRFPIRAPGYYKEYAKAQQRINAALEKKPDAYYAWFLLGLCQENTGMKEAAIRSFQQCMQLWLNPSRAGNELNCYTPFLCLCLAYIRRR